jgi:hypothetical protein
MALYVLHKLPGKPPLALLNSQSSPSPMAAAVSISSMETDGIMAKMDQ